MSANIFIDAGIFAFTFLGLISFVVFLFILISSVCFWSISKNLKVVLFISSLMSLTYTLFLLDTVGVEAWAVWIARIVPALGILFSIVKKSDEALAAKARE